VVCLHVDRKPFSSLSKVCIAISLAELECTLTDLETQQQKVHDLRKDEEVVGGGGDDCCCGALTVLFVVDTLLRRCIVTDAVDVVLLILLLLHAVAFFHSQHPSTMALQPSAVDNSGSRHDHYVCSTTLTRCIQQTR
jgi:hypothetical protein